MPPSPSIDSLITISQKFVQETRLLYVFGLDTYLSKNGLKSHELLTNLIASESMEAESMYDSCTTFVTRSYKSKDLWGIRITGCIECGDSRQALHLYKQSQQKSSTTFDGATYVALLKACIDLRDLETGFQIHDKVSKDGLLQCDTYIGNKLVDLYAKCGPLSKAQDMFDNLAARDVVSWNTLIAGYLKHKQGKEAVDCFEKMQVSGFSPNAITLVHCLRACVLNEDTCKGRQVHMEITRKGYCESYQFIGNALVDMHAKLGSIEDAQHLFDKLAVRDVVSWTTLIAGYVKQELSKEALSCFEQMKIQGLIPNAITFVCALKACGNVRSLIKGAELHDEVVKEGLLENNLVGNAVVDMYAKCGCPAKAMEVLYELPVQDVISWNALIGGYIKDECDEEALGCFTEMQTKGVSPDATTFVCGLKASSNLGKVEIGEEIYVEVVRRGLLEEDAVMGNSLVDMYAKCGYLSRAREVFDCLPNRTVVSWTSLISEYTECDLAVHALDCLEQMQHEGFCSNVVTLSCSLKACGMIMDIEKGRSLHAEIERKGLLQEDIDIGNGLVIMYSKCGFLAEAEKILDKLPVKNVGCWNALIVGYVMEECDAAALECLNRMLLYGISPNATTFVYSLKVCGSVGDANKAKDLHALILQNGSVQSDRSVGASLIEAYAKLGMFDEAQQVFGMFSERDISLWTSLITGYSYNEDVDKALICIRQMQEEGISPNAATFTCILKACGRVGALDKGRDLHVEIARNGWMERNLALGNALTDMYAKCGLLTFAHEVVENLSVRDVISWNVLIAGYAQQELAEEALHCYEQMQHDELQPNSVTYTCTLSACAGSQITGEVIDIVFEVARRGFLATDQVVGNAVVNLYAQCGMLGKAREIFDNLPYQDVPSWTTLIDGYAKFNHEEEAIACFSQMQLEGLFPNAATLICILKVCGMNGASEMGRQIHANISFQGIFIKDIAVGNALLNMYAKSGSLASSLQLLDKLPLRNTVSWNTLISEYSNQGRSEEVLSSYEQMRMEGICPSSVTLICSLKACGCIGAVDKARDIYAELLKNGVLRTDHMVGTALVSMYLKFGLPEKAHEIFDMLPVKTTASWIALISGSAAHVCGEEAIHHFDQMVLKGTDSDHGTSICSSSDCLDVEASEELNKLGAGIPIRELQNRNLFVGSDLINTYAKHGSLANAKKVFNKLQARDVVLWTVLMEGYIKHDLIEEALNCYDQMQQEGVSPDSAALVCGLKACASIGALQKGREIHAEISRKGLLEIDLVVGNALVDMYARCGALEKALEVFDELLILDVVTWTALITGYAQSGDVDSVFSIFEAMRREVKKPDVVAFLKVLDACSRSDVPEKAQLYMEVMQKEYGMSPRLKHYNCMIDLFSRAGDVEGVEEVIREMPFDPDGVVWRTILGACWKWGHADLGRRVFENVLLLDQ